MNIYHYHWAFLKNSKKALCAKMYNNIYYSDDKGKARQHIIEHIVS